MLKRVVLLLTATAFLTVPGVGLLAASPASADGVLPEGACLAALPAHTQPLLCGRGAGGPGAG